MSTNNLRKSIAGLYYGWRMIGIVSALRVLGGGLHQYGFTVFFLPVTQDLGLTRASTSLAFSLARPEGSLAAPIVGYFAAGAVYDRTESCALVFSGITVSLIISAALTALLIKPWARVGKAVQIPITKPIR